MKIAPLACFNFFLGGGGGGAGNITRVMTILINLVSKIENFGVWFMVQFQFCNVLGEERYRSTESIFVWAHRK